MYCGGDLPEENAGIHCQMLQRHCGLTIFKIQSWENRSEDLSWAIEKTGVQRSCPWLRLPFSAFFLPHALSVWGSP